MHFEYYLLLGAVTELELPFSAIMSPWPDEIGVCPLKLNIATLLVPLSTNLISLIA